MLLSLRTSTSESSGLVVSVATRGAPEGAAGAEALTLDEAVEGWHPSLPIPSAQVGDDGLAVMSQHAFPNIHVVMY